MFEDKATKRVSIDLSCCTRQALTIVFKDKATKRLSVDLSCCTSQALTIVFKDKANKRVSTDLYCFTSQALEGQVTETAMSKNLLVLLVYQQGIYH